MCVSIYIYIYICTYNLHVHGLYLLAYFSFLKPPTSSAGNKWGSAGEQIDERQIMCNWMEIHVFFLSPSCPLKLYRTRVLFLSICMFCRCLLGHNSCFSSLNYVSMPLCRDK